jgi:hypothetical protein
MSANQRILAVVACFVAMGASAALSGCARNADAESTPTEQAGNATGVAVSSNRGTPIQPVRIDRGFFQVPLTAKLSLQPVDSNLEAGVDASPVAWKEFEPTGDVPPDAIADFRDHKGCASFRADTSSGVSLCFNIMGDVSNIGLNEREMSIEGLGAAINAGLSKPCASDQWTTRLTGVSREQDTAFTVRVEAQAPAGCEAGPVNAALTLTRQ